MGQGQTPFFDAHPHIIKGCCICTPQSNNEFHYGLTERRRHLYVLLSNQREELVHRYSVIDKVMKGCSIMRMEFTQ